MMAHDLHAVRVVRAIEGDTRDYALMLEAQSNPLKAGAVEVISAMGTIFHRELPFRGRPLGVHRMQKWLNT